jgi:hypothetical protein
MIPRAKTLFGRIGQPGCAAVLSGGMLLVFPVDAPADEALVAPQLANSIGVELAPEFRAQSGALVDGYIKGNLAHTFDNGLIWTGTVQYNDKVDGNSTYRAETTFGYAIKLNETWSVPVNAGLGYRWDEDPRSQPSPAFAYYVVNAGLNMKISDSWTWNAISARWRDAFEGDWETPKVTTGLTYAIDRQNSVYANVGYAWKNGQPNKISLAIGYKYGF